jgi:hypothetical protein
MLAFSGLARRTTQRDWTLEDAAAAAAKAEAEKLRAEFAAKFQAATTAAPASAGDERGGSFLDEKVAPDDGFRKPIDTSRDDEPESAEEEKGEKDEWEQLDQEDELPTFFDALKPHMRRNQRGPGTSVGVDYLAKKWGLDEGDVKGALVECGLQIPADENAKPVYVEYDGDLYWVNINRRGEIWINEREKPRPVFRIVQGAKVAPETEETPAEPKHPRHESNRPPRPEPAAPAPESAEAAPATEQTPKSEPAPAASLPPGSALLDKIRPLMRRNRRGSGGSGSATFLARALKCAEADLVNGFLALGLVVPATAADPSVNVEVGHDVWWLNKDSRGGLWINGREKRDNESAKPTSAAPEGTPTAPAGSEPAVAPVDVSPSAPAPEAVPTPVETPAPEVAPVAESSTVPSAPAPVAEPVAAPVATDTSAPSPLAAVRLLLKETRTGAFAGKVERVAGELGKPAEELTASLVAAGLVVPEKSREKPVFVEHAGEIFWFNLNAKNELWVNAKASKFAGEDDTAEDDDESGEKKPSRRGGRSRKSAASDETAAGDSTPPVEPA